MIAKKESVSNEFTCVYQSRHSALSRSAAPYSLRLARKAICLLVFHAMELGSQFSEVIDFPLQSIIASNMSVAWPGNGLDTPIPHLRERSEMG